MAVDIFLQVEGVSGESQDSNHKGWIDALSYTWGASQPGNVAVGGGGGAGKVTYRDLSVQALIDKATPTLLTYCSSGKHVTKVILSVCKAGGTQIEYSRITLEDVLITLTEFNGVSNTDTIAVNYNFQAAKVSLKYWIQTEKGGKGAEVSGGWNIKKNVGL